MTQQIGFIGLGIMGAPMAANILRGGHPLTVYNRTREKCEPLQQAGAAVAGSPAELIAACDIIIMMLSDDSAVDAVLHDEAGLLSGDCREKIIINMGTMPPRCVRAWSALLESHGATLIDAPVSGSRIPAEKGTLVILAGGPEATIVQLEPLLLTMGCKVIRCGAIGNGSEMKLAVNLLLGTMMEGLAEAVHLAESSGLTAESLLDAVAAGPLSCTLFGLKAEMFKNGEYPPQFPFRHMAKDMQLILADADECGANLPLGSRLAELFSPDADPALMDQDFAAVKTLLERR